jgi:hypothetical protein
MQDKGGRIWICTLKGLSAYDGKSVTYYSNLGDIQNIVQDKTGKLWFGSFGNGVISYDGKTFSDFDTTQGLIGNLALSVMQDKDGNMWIGTNAGASKYDGRNFTNYSSRQGLSASVNCILQDKNGDIWFGSNAGTGVTMSGDRDMIVRNSIIHDHPIQGIFNGSNSGQQIYNNLLYNNFFGIQLSGPDCNTRIYNNTILGRQDSRIGLTAGIHLQANICSQVIENNIIADFNLGIVIDPHTAAPHTIANNLLYNNVIPGQGVYDINDFSNGAYTLSNNLMGIFNDARFVNAAARDYRLLSGSPAIDAGNANGLTADADGCLRPVGAGIDIGAYEYAPSCSSR